MEQLPPVVSASLGAMGSLAGKLDGLLDADLKAEFGKLTTRLLKLSKSPDPPETARIWMKDVRELSYDMQNCVDAQEDLKVEIPEFMARVKEANGRYERYVPESITGPSDLVPIGVGDHRHRTVGGGLKSDPVVGLHDEGGAVYKLTQWLADDDKALKVASILGVGGIGKTTLAKQLWREKKLERFECRAFVRTAKKPDMRRILRSILAQVRPHQPPDANGVHELIQDLTEHLQNKRYFIIIDDLWATSVWHVARRAFPEGNGSRIVTTTEIQDVALACCSYESQYMFKMESLSPSHSKELFISAVFGSGEQHSRQLDGVSNEIIRRCAGLPQAIVSICSVLASLGEANTVQNREKIQNNLPTNATSDEILKQVLIFCYNCLPSCLQTCLLYLSIYPENYIILKEVITKQWVGEGFICAPTENEKMKVAESYFDKLVHMGMIQQIDVEYSDEVLYYAVHHMVHDIITTKSTEENFVTVIDYSKRTVRFSNKVRRLSLQFGSATYATSPESIGMSEIQSLAFIGLKSCYYSSILEFKVLRVLILHIWADEPSTGVDLKPTSELVLLRYLQVTCNDTVHLPDLGHGLEHLETLEINARVTAIPANIVHLRSWFHLRLGVGTEVPDLTGTLQIVTTLNPPISLDDSSCSCKSGKTMELLSPICSCKSVKTLELLSPICRVPKWIGQLTNLFILKFVVRELQRDDINNLERLSFLTVLSLHVQGPTTGLIGFASGAFSALEYFEFRCGVLRLMFQEGTMPNLQRLKLGFNAHPRDGFLLVGVEDLLSVKEISGIIRVAAGAVERDLQAAESVFKKAMGRHPNVSIERADMVEELDVPVEKQHEIPEEPPSKSSEQTGITKQESPDVHGLGEKQHLIGGKHTQDYQTEIKKDFTSKKEKQHEIPEEPPSKSSEQTGITKQESPDVHGLGEKQHLIGGKHTQDYQAEIKKDFTSKKEKQHEIPEEPPSKSSEQTGITKQESPDVRGLGEKQHLIGGKHTQDYQTEIKKDFTSKKEKQHEIPEEPPSKSSEQTGITKQESPDVHGLGEKQHLIGGKHTQDYQTEIKKDFTSKKEKQHEIPEEPPLTSSEQTGSLNQESRDGRGRAQKQHPTRGQPTSKSSEQTGILKQVYQYTRDLGEKQHLIGGKPTQDYQMEIKQDSSSDSRFIKSSGPAELTINGEGDLHILDQLLVSNKETRLEKLTLERCPPLDLKHLMMLTTLKTLIVNDSDGLVEQLGGQGDVEWQLPVWCPKLQELKISNCPKFSPLIPMSWVESLHCVTIEHVKLLEELTYFKSWRAVLKITGKSDLHSLDQVLVFDKETSLATLTLERCPPLELKHLLMLTSLKTLIVIHSYGVVGPLGGQGDVEWQLPVEHMRIIDLNGNSGKKLTGLLPHLPKLSNLEIWKCKNIKTLVVGVDVQQTTSEASGMGGGEITAAAAAEEEDDGVLLFPDHLCGTLRELRFSYCTGLILVDSPTLVPGRGGLQALRSLQRLTIQWSPKFLSTFSFSCHNSPSSLQFLELTGVEGMGTLEPFSNLSSLTKLDLGFCGTDLKCEGLQSLLTTEGQLNELRVIGSPGFFVGWDPNPKQGLEDVEEQQTQLVSSTLLKLCTDDIAGLLAAPICRFLSSSLTKLTLAGDGCEGMQRFSKEQEDALQLLSSLQQLEFEEFNDLEQLPSGLQNLTSLKKLTINDCPAVSSLPNDGLPKSLQELDVRYSRSEELKQQCSGLVGIIPKVIIQY